MAALALRIPEALPLTRARDRAQALARLWSEQLTIVWSEDDWTAAEISILRNMRARGSSYATCSRALPGRSRNACISKAWRLGLPAPPSQFVDARIIANNMPMTAARVADWALGRAGDVIAIPSAGKSFLELGPKDCRWPFGDGRHMRFCGCHAPDGSYCAEHAAASVEPRNTAISRNH